MKINIINVWLAVFFLFSCVNGNKPKDLIDLVQSPLTADEDADEVEMPEIALEKESFDFGEINQDESISIEFKLKNIGNAPLIIRSVKGSCGCTVPEWPREPIKPGNEASIKVTFDSKGKTGKQNKRVTLMTNAIPNVKILTIKGEIITN
jgi:hypothetical protein